MNFLSIGNLLRTNSDTRISPDSKPFTLIEKFEMSCFVFSLTETVVLTPFCIENPAPREPNCLESSLSNSALKKPVICAGQNAVAIMIKPTWMENINTWLK